MNSEIQSEHKISFATGTYAKLDNHVSSTLYIAQIDHIPPKSTYDLFNERWGEIFTPRNMPCILLPHVFHKLLITTGNDGKNGPKTKFRNEQRAFILKGDFGSAIEMNILEYRKTVPVFLTIVTDVNYSNPKTIDYLNIRLKTKRDKEENKNKTDDVLKEEAKDEIKMMKERFYYRTEERDFLEDLKTVLNEYVTEVGERKYTVRYKETEEIKMLKEYQVNKLKEIINAFPLSDDEFKTELWNINKKYKGYELPGPLDQASGSQESGDAQVNSNIASNTLTDISDITKAITELEIEDSSSSDEEDVPMSGKNRASSSSSTT